MDSRFNEKIYRWSLTATPGKWYRLDSLQMDRDIFIDAIKYLIECGEPLEFNNDYSKVRRELKIDWTD